MEKVLSIITMIKSQSYCNICCEASTTKSFIENMTENSEVVQKLFIFLVFRNNSRKYSSYSSSYCPHLYPPGLHRGPQHV